MSDRDHRGLQHGGLDHLGIVVPDTNRALELWRDTFGFVVVTSEVVNGGTTRLTHLDLGNTQLQLVEPLTQDHPLREWLKVHGPGSHHFCLKVDDVGEAKETSPVSSLNPPHQGVGGKRALFLDRTQTQDVLVEVTGA